MREKLAPLIALAAISLVACQSEQLISPISTVDLPTLENNNKITNCGTVPGLGNFEVETSASGNAEAGVFITPTGVDANCELTPEPTATPTPSNV